ncbi:hypothetical protein TELCIR_00457 [Teladorsagia circumcincta]|uniref:ELM2 domain-containing protein n=1 Tax=Teladorsagia circumcincta TaxID=45464 RepID=A0A2G9V636_TELCI|nr:hypothetical protein TELCIR_00457 [Teladorsagia circumcincta]
MSSDEKVDDIDESILDEPVEGANAVDDEEIDESILDHEIEIDAPSEAQSDAHSYTQSDTSPPRSAEEVKEENSNDTQHTDSEEKPKRNGDSPPKVMWRPPGDLDETKLLEFCEDAIGVYKLSYDRALYLLQKSNFDFDLAREKMKTRRLITEEWSEDDRTLFKQAFHMFGKRFDKIRQTVGSLIWLAYHAYHAAGNFYTTPRDHASLDASPFNGVNNTILL